MVCCVDGLTGFPEAIEAVYPQAWVQTCLVHVVRSSLRFVPYKDKRKVAADLKKIYTAVDRDHAETELERFAETWDGKYPMISASWLERWERIVPFLAFPPDVRRAVYTTNTIEALNRQIRKIIKTRGSFPTKTPPASSSTSRSPAPNRNGGTPTTGARPSPPSASTSATASPTQPDCHRKVTVTR
jgi:putative transposase